MIQRSTFVMAAGLMAAGLMAAGFMAAPGAMAQTADPMPDKVAAYLAWCPTRAAQCAKAATEVALTSLAAELFAREPAPAKVCRPPERLSAREVNTAVLAWLAAHPETAGLDRDVGIQSAFTALWPCG